MQTTRRGVLAGSAGLAVLAACQKQAASPDLNAVLDQISTKYLQTSPEFATSLAVTEAQAGGRYIDRLSDYSKAGLEKTKSIYNEAKTMLGGISRTSLSKDDAVSYDVVNTSIDEALKALQWEVGTGATAPYVVSQLTGSYTQIPDFLDSQHPVTNRDQADAYVTRLGLYAQALDAETQRIGEDQAAGVVPPDFAIDQALVQLRTFASKSANKTVLVESLVRRLPGVHEIADADRNTLIQHATQIVHDQVLPAYQRQIAAMQGLRPHAVHDAGIWRLPHGDEMYAAALESNTTTTMSPDEVHNMGVQIAQQLTSEMDAILKAQGLTNGTVAARIQSLFKRPDQLYPNTDAGREQCLAYLNQLVQAMRARCPEKFNTMAHADLQIKRVPPYTEAGAPGGYYNGAALDGSRPGSYYINMRDMHELPKFTLPTLTYHEGIPGHHWQISIAQEAHALPFIRRALLGFNAYAEGWALYAEQLADEMGFYASDPFGRLGYLKDAAFRASRLVVDTGMHAKRWTREQAIQSMMAVTGDIESNVATEIERYAVWPGQACGYMVGKQTILRLRAESMTALGDHFDIKGFHDAVLLNGSTPLTVLESIVHSWSASQRPA